jgi:ABC-2 type transport system permease protein
MTAFVHHFSFEFRSGVRNKALMLLNYLFPLGFYLMASALMVNLNPTFRDNLIPAMVFFTLLTSTLLGLPDPLVTAREAGIFRSYKIHGIPQISILLIPVLTTILHTTIVSVFIVVSAPLLFQAPLPANGLSFVLAFLLMAFCCAGIALLIGVIAPNSRATVLMGQAIFLPSMMIGGLMFPAHLLPDALQKLSLLLPSTHAMNALNGWVEGDLLTLNPYLSVGVLYAAGALAFLAAAYLFNWDSQNKARRLHPAFALVVLVPFLISLAFSFI